VKKILLFNNFVPIVDISLIAKIQLNRVVRCRADGEFLVIFLDPAFPASRVQHISDLHSKYALGPHHV